MATPPTEIKAADGDIETGDAPKNPTMAPAPTIEEKKEGGVGDVETGGAQQLRWAFIRKVYSILTIQLIATVGIAAIFVFDASLRNAFLNAPLRITIPIFFCVLLAPFFVMIPMMVFRERHPWNLLLLAIFTVSISFSVGIVCIITDGKVIMGAAGLTVVVVLALSLYTFWAARKGRDFNFLGPFLFASLVVLLCYGLLQIFYPLGPVYRTIFGCLSALIFAAIVVYDTDNLIKRHKYDEYVIATISLYLDVVNIFLAFIGIYRC